MAAVITSRIAASCAISGMASVLRCDHDRAGWRVSNAGHGDRVHHATIITDRHNQWWITHNVLCAYLGANTGPKVLTGQIRRGTGMELTAVLWSSDLRGFTERSDRLPSERMIAILNALFEAQAAEIRGHGGEMLKFIGDGLLAIFPIAETDAVAAIATAAVAAARNALAAVAGLARRPEMDDEPPLDIVVALHVGTVHYGNIGATTGSISP